jgi:hypothetical protein
VASPGLYAAKDVLNSETEKYMKPLFIRPLSLAVIAIVLSATANAPARSMVDIPGVPVSALQVYMPREAWQRLANAPVKAYILVRGQVLNNKVFGARVAHSEARGVYDKVAVQMANTMSVYSDTIGSRIPATVLIHVLIYGLPDNSEDALAIAQNDAVGGANLVYSRSLMMRHLGLANQAPKKKK